MQVQNAWQFCCLPFLHVYCMLQRFTPGAKRKNTAFCLEIQLTTLILLIRTNSRLPGVKCFIFLFWCVCENRCLAGAVYCIFCETRCLPIDHFALDTRWMTKTLLSVPVRGNNLHIGQCVLRARWHSWNVIVDVNWQYPWSNTAYSLSVTMVSWYSIVKTPVNTHPSSLAQGALQWRSSVSVQFDSLSFVCPITGSVCLSFATSHITVGCYLHWN